MFGVEFLELRFRICPGKWRRTVFDACDVRFFTKWSCFLACPSKHTCAMNCMKCVLTFQDSSLKRHVISMSVSILWSEPETAQKTFNSYLVEINFHLH